MAQVHQDVKGWLHTQRNWLKKDLEALKSWREEFKSRKVKGVSNL
jgi:hypothetical protein